MKTIFRKAITVLGSAALIGASISAAAAAAYPTPFTSDTAIVTGANANALDNAAAVSIAAVLNAANAGSTVTTLDGGSGVTEPEVPLGGQIDFASSKVKSILTTSKIPGLLDDRITWDDGTGSNDYRVHEAISIGDMAIKTTLNDEDLKGVAMSNNKGLEYKYIFNDAFPASRVGMDNTTGTADDLYLTILGKQYEVQSMTSTSITVVTSEQQNVQVGSSVVVDGKTFTLTDVYENSVIVNGVVIGKGDSKKVDGMKVQIDDILYSSDNLANNKAILRIGENIQKTYSDGDEFIGQNEDDPLWVWDISNLGDADGYIGVKYDASIENSDDNDAGGSIKYAGGAYVMPNNFAQVSLDSISDLGYETVNVSFDDRMDLYNDSDTSDTAVNNGMVAVLNGENDDTFTSNGSTTSELYLYYANNATANLGAVGNNGSIVAFYKDVNGDYAPTKKARLANRIDLTAPETLTSTKIGQLDVGDTTMDIDVSVAGGVLNVTFVDPLTSDISLNIGGDQLTNTAGTIEGLGSSLEDAQATDITVNGTNVGTKEGSIMDYYGTIVAKGDEVKNNADNDKVTLSIPSDQIYAQVSVTAGGQAAESGDAGVMTVTDANAASVSGKNLIVVGGSAINSVAADLLGGAYRGDDFTAMTGVSAGQALIESFAKDGKTALLVAGYNAADTSMATTYLNNENVDTTVGTKLKVTSATQATTVTA